jgi:pteridine reductase
MATLAGKVALVTGAARRVGKVIALALAKEGADIALHFNSDPQAAADTADELTALGVRVTTLRADLRSSAAATALPAQAADALGRLDILVNSAAMMLRTPIGDVTEDDWEQMFALNVRAPFFVSQAAAPLLRPHRGVIVNIADLAAFETWPAYVPHAMTKASVVQMTRGMARALAPEIRVNAVAPGAVHLPDDWTAATATRLASTTPLQRIGEVEDVAHAVLYLCHATYVTGEVIIVDGGRHVRT